MQQAATTRSDNLTIRLRPGMKNLLKAGAEVHGITVTQMLDRAIMRAILDSSYAKADKEEGLLEVYERVLSNPKAAKLVSKAANDAGWTRTEWMQKMAVALVVKAAQGLGFSDEEATQAAERIRKDADPDSVIARHEPETVLDEVLAELLSRYDDKWSLRELAADAGLGGQEEQVQAVLGIVIASVSAKLKDVQEAQEQAA